MHAWHRADLTAAGRIVLDDAGAEAIARSQPRVGLYHDQIRLPSPFDDGTLHVSSHRIVWVAAAATTTSKIATGDVTADAVLARLAPASTVAAVAIQLDRIDRAWLQAGFLRSSPKITLDLVWTDLAPPSTGTPGTASTTSLAVPAAAKPWSCAVCDFANFGPPSTKCARCGVVPTPPSTSAACPQCTFANRASATVCAMCAYPLPSSSTTICPRCTLANPVDATKCRACTYVLRDEEAVMLPPVLKTATVKLSFRGGGANAVYKAIKDALQAQAWKRVTSPRERAVSSSVTASRDAVRLSPMQGRLASPLAPSMDMGFGMVAPIGVGGLVKRQEQEQQLQQQTLDSAFADLDALMAKAHDMVTLSNAIAAKLRARTATGTESDEALVAQFRSSMMALGATAALGAADLPSSRAATTDDRDRALAREVADFLHHVFAQGKGQGQIIAVSDLYCMFNRARGVAMVSPHDFWTAAQVLAMLQVGFEARTLASGTRVVHAARFADAALFTDLRQWAARDALDVATAAARWGVAVALAAQLLKHAVAHGCVVVDAPADMYFANRFLEA
ncbi:hypothetical protein AMAG_09225 [Allomyces macrogynus ATCC 38327]|uniref:Vacuolar protein-sorting-associated protein 36 n=1 Tax=Allomyces macrogynus (strain ATCC 38327) TaxID=578462 RepID=A0A0L0SNW0_ALLM3|nr:hypothetical protein AMAG_09225 [Allomyces macrogynus ATCC 38327]|eukprot:KNE64182.1 hypothetical protein AMAG_09225 [Allomyces macrogynus ATCC 38327]